MNMKTINTCDSINDIFGENAELTIPMECPEIVSHIRKSLLDKRFKMREELYPARYEISSCGF